MKRYDPSRPLIFSHIPKTAGTSVVEVFRGWFGANMLPYYPGARAPVRHDLNAPPEPGRPVLVYGHFNRGRGFGVETAYPEIDQFYTLLRDPWEQAVSGYFYASARPKANAWFAEIAAMTLEDFIRVMTYEDRVYTNPTSNFLPLPCDLATYAQMLESRFIALGITERLELSLAHLAQVLGVAFDPASIPFKNVSPRAGAAPDHLRGAFAERHALSYAIYDYARAQVETPRDA